MKITVAQLNPTVGDVRGNVSKMVRTLEEISRRGADLAVFPELFITGYPPKDLLEHRWFIDSVEKGIQEVLEHSRLIPGLGILFGAPLRGPTGKSDSRNARRRYEENGLFNAAVLAFEGKVIFIQHKSLLPTYDVFDEARYFDPASEIDVVNFKNEVLGISICEDAWNDPEALQVRKLYPHDPIEDLAEKGATIFINISASPYSVGKEETRFRLIANHASKHRIPFLYVNQVGGNDEIIFDGRSMFIGEKGELREILHPFEEEVAVIDTASPHGKRSFAAQDPAESVYGALVLGVKDYMRKCGFRKAIVGLSGGIDSAVTACIAVEAVGKENVAGITMPSPFSSRGSVEDSRALARNLDISFKIVPITDIYESYLSTFAKHFTDTLSGIADTPSIDNSRDIKDASGTGSADGETFAVGEPYSIVTENVQARIRGNILMAFSNRYGCLVLSTGNKSELSTGYCTLYGDMSGGLAVISDVPKTMIYELARHINREREMIPKAIIEKTPSAELKPNQTDQDTLPPYPVLDEILQLYIEKGLPAEEIIGMGIDAETVWWVVRTVAKNEYKRKQAPPGLKVTTKAFGVGRRMPIAARYIT